MKNISGSAMLDHPSTFYTKGYNLNDAKNYTSDNSPQSASGYQRNNNFVNLNNLYTTSPAPQNPQQAMPRQYSYSSMPKFDKSGDFEQGFFKNQNFQHVIDWINSFNDPYCLLVNSLADLTDGIALCHLVGFIACSQSDQDKIRQLVYYDAVTAQKGGELHSDLSVQNLDLAINVLKSSNLPVSPEIQKIEASQITSPESPKLLQFLETLKSIHEILSFGANNSVTVQRPRTPPPKGPAKPEQYGGHMQQQKAEMISQVASTTNLQANNFTPHYTSTQSVMPIQSKESHMQPTPQQKFISDNQRLTSYGVPVANSDGPIMIAPRCTAVQLTTSQSKPQIQSQSTGRGGVQGEMILSYQLSERVTNSNKYQMLSSQSDAKSNQDMQVAQAYGKVVMPFPNSQQLQRLANPYEEKRNENSLDINTISPICNDKRSVSPITNTSKEKSVKVPRVNIQAAIQHSQAQLQDLEEHQLMKELTDLNISYQRAVQYQGVSKNKISASRNSSTSKSGATSQRRIKTSSQEHKDRIRQKQTEINDYGNVLKNTQNLMLKSKITDIDVNFQMTDKTNRVVNSMCLEPPSSILMESQNRLVAHQHQIFSERLIDTSLQTKMRSNDENQRSIRFKEDPYTERVEKDERKSSRKYNEVEEIMSEMQTLNVQPIAKESNNATNRTVMFSEITVEPVDMKIKQRVLEWLSSQVKLVKTNQRLIDDLPLYCKNGVFLCDLANRLSGRVDTIKGVDRNPKNVTSILTNFNRVLDYLRSFPRFCPRFLWAQRYLMEGNSDVVWGLLDDIWHWHFNKISPNDPTHQKHFQQNHLQSSSRSPDKTLSPKGSIETQKHKFINAVPTLSSKPKSAIKPLLPPKVSSTQVIKRTESRNNYQQDLNISHSLNVQRTPMKGAEDSQRGIRGSQSLGRDRSYSNLHQKTPTNSVLQNSDMPIQIQNSAKKAAEALQSSAVQKNLESSNRSASRTKRNNSSRRVNVSAFASPIAKDQAGNLYYLKSVDDFVIGAASFDDRNANTLFASNKSQNIHQYLEITDAIEGDIRNWLFNLNFGHYLSKEFEYRDICNDPFSNGLLLAELFSYLEKITLFKLIQAPRTINESKDNLSKVLSIIRQRRRDFPMKLLNDQSIEGILKRDKQTIYSILYHLKQAYPDLKTNQSSTPHLSALVHTPDSKHSQNLSLPYSSGELKLLEVSLLNWIRRLGILQKLYGPLDIESFLQIQKDLSNGLLLSELVSLLFNTKLTGIFKDPKTEGTAISNLRKPLEILRKQAKMSQKFTWTEKELYEGRLSVYMGLLEDLHRCYDGLPPRKRGLNYFSDGPYLGDTLYDNQETEQKPTEDQNVLETVKSQPYLCLPSQQNVGRQQTKYEGTLSTLKTAPGEGFKLEILNEKNKFYDLPSIFNNHKLLMGSDATNKSTLNQIKQISTISPTSATKVQIQDPKDSTEQNLFSQKQGPNFGQFLSLKLQKEHQSVSPLRSSLKRNQFLKPTIFTEERTSLDKFVKKHNFTLPQQQQDILSSQKKDITEQYPVAPTRSPLNVNSRCQKQSFEFDLRSNLKKQPIEYPDYDNEEHHLNRFAYQIQEKARLTEWINSLEGLQLPLGFNLEVEPINFFRDGILLCNLVSELEGFRIENIQLNPKSQAGCLQNIRKALQVLKKKNQVPLYLLFSEEEITNGNPEIILQLLKSLKSAYKSKVAVRLSASIGRKSKENGQ